MQTFTYTDMYNKCYHYLRDGYLECIVRWGGDVAGVGRGRIGNISQITQTANNMYLTWYYWYCRNMTEMCFSSLFSFYTVQRFWVVIYPCTMPYCYFQYTELQTLFKISVYASNQLSRIYKLLRGNCAKRCNIVTTILIAWGEHFGKRDICICF